jgi:hypothetical protein
MVVYNDLIYLPQGPFRNSYSVALLYFAISTSNPATMLLALGYEGKQRTRKKRKNVNFTEDTVTVTGSK